MRKINFGQLVLAALIGGAISVVGVALLSSSESEQGATKTTTTSSSSTPAVKMLYTQNSAGEMVPIDFTGTAKECMPMVVNIRSRKQQQYGSNRQGYGSLKDFFDPYGRGQQQQREEDIEEFPIVGSGSGVIISQDGYIVTNNHVVAGADKLDVILTDNREYEAEVIGRDPSTDIAVIRIKESGLPFVNFANSDNVQIGEWVLAIGNPLSLTNTVTAGIVSAKGRAIGILGQNKENYERIDPKNYGDSSGGGNVHLNNSIESFIQTDAAINPGNSGGALVNLSGELIGINTAIASQTGAYTGYAFAVPSNLVSKVVNDLIEFGAVQRGVLGIIIKSVDSDFAKENDLDVVSGVFVSQVAVTSGAKDAGVLEGDVITAVNDIPVRNVAVLQGIIGSSRPGDSVTLSINREGEVVKLDVVLKNREGNTDIVKKKVAGVAQSLGVVLKDIDKETLNKLEISSGVEISEISSGAIAKQTRIRDGFIITKIDGKQVKDVEYLERYLDSKRGEGVMVEGVYKKYRGTYYAAFGVPE